MLLRTIVRFTQILTVLLMYAVLAGCGASSATSAGVHVVAATGDPAPGLPDGYLFEGIDPNYTMGASGLVLFSGSANIERGSASDRKRVLWFGEPGALEPVVTVGQPIPGAEDALVADFSPLPRIVTEDGTAAFVVRPSIYPQGYLPQSLLAYHDGALRKVIANGDTVPTPEGDGRLLTISQFVITDAGLLLMGTYARRKTALWFWDFSTLELVIAEGTEVSIGDFACKIRSLESTTLDMNQAGFAIFRASMFGNNCRYGGLVGWDRKSGTHLAVSMNREPVAAGSSDFFRSTSGDARVSDDGQIALHAIIYRNEGQALTRSVTMLQTIAGGPSIELIHKATPIDDAPDLKMTHALHSGGMAPLGDGALVHFVRNHHDRIILRTTLDGQAEHSLVAHAGTTLDESVAARIGNAASNRDGDTVFASFIDDDKPGGKYQQQVWLSTRKGALTRLAYAGLAVVDRDGAIIERIEMSNQSHEPTMVSTQGGRSRTIADNGSVLFGGRIQEASRTSNALFVAKF
ncbi:MAG: hypothetical protein AAF004_03465 [Pseudomonadota bacterium]